MALQAMWTHGVNAFVQYNDFGRDDCTVDGYGWTNVVGQRYGYGAVYRGQKNTNFWFHLPIPTPVIKDDKRAEFRRAYLLFKTDPQVALVALHVWDGATKIFPPPGPPWGVTGDHSGLPLEKDINYWELPHQGVGFGVVICANFAFGDFGNVTLCSAGIDFEI